MPQFDFANVFWPQLAWLAVFFIVLYFGVVRATLPKLGKVMTAREDRIAGDLSAAQAAKQAADEIDTRYHAELEAAREQSRNAIAAAKLEAAGVGEQRLKAASAAADARLAEAETRIAASRAEAQDTLRVAAAESAAAIVARLTGREPAHEAALAKVGASLAGQD
ncbi:ATPase [Novosphingobium tardum]|jgi:F-type H+-transporting ATPase subunit b|uniref:ATP synthase subunit b n=1 Tax=Novosphingobium tardum TaxID=1538021 RepID=A0ABV8RR99_9SPHN